MRRASHRLPLLALCASVVACGARSGLLVADGGDPCGDVLTRPCRTECGVGVETCRDGVFTGCTAPRPRPPGASVTLRGTVRDLRDTHPDMELPVFGVDRGIVLPTLGADRTPVYASATTTPSTRGGRAFAQWFHDAPGVNLARPIELTLRRESDSLTYSLDDLEFFPIDGQLLGNEGRAHNYHFTLEVHGEFTYRGGEVFTFAGDDDLWAFLAGRLVIDLGGVHSRESETVRLDTFAPVLGLTRGNVYALDLFFAERHTTGSTLRIATTIASFDACR